MSLDLLRAEAKRHLLELRRYPIESLGELVVLTAIFYGLFAGASYLAGGSAGFGERLDEALVGYLSFTFAMAVLSTFSWQLMTEVLQGTIEQLYMSPYGLPRILAARTGAAIGTQLAVVALLLVVLSALTGARLELRAWAAVPFATILVGAAGLGLGLAGLQLVFKRTQPVLQLVQWVLLFLLMTPVESLGGPFRILLYGAPLASSAAGLRDALARGAGLDVGLALLAAANALAWFGIGLALFGLALRTVKRRGIASGY